MENFNQWVMAATALVNSGIMLKKEFAELFRRFNAQLTPEEQKAALAKVYAEATARKASAEAEVVKTQVKIDARPKPPTT